jgi:hypothetical protein
LNPHALRRRNLNPVRLPIPPLVLDHCCLGERRDSASWAIRLPKGLRGGRFWLRFRSRFLDLGRDCSSRGGRRGCDTCHPDRRPRRWGRCTGGRKHRSFERRRPARLRNRCWDRDRSLQCRAHNFGGGRRPSDRRAPGRRFRCLLRSSPARVRRSWAKLRVSSPLAAAQSVARLDSSPPR